MTKQDQDKFMLRLPEGMRDRVAQSAKVNHRSMNAEIIFNLQRQFGAKETTGSGLDAVDPAVPSEGAAARAAP